MFVREEAFPFAGPPALAAAVLGVLGHPVGAAVALLAAAAVCAFFRDPERIPPGAPLDVVSPADGRVVKAQELPDGRLMISVFMSVFNVHVNRSPFGGRVESVRYNPGKFMAAWSDKASLDNEQTGMVFRTDRGDYEVVMIAGLIARRIVCWANPGRTFGRGERIGLIRFGSRVDLYLPGGLAEALVSPGDRVRAGSTSLARWRERP
jgi:phosphatidylserine decarboxylase